MKTLNPYSKLGTKYMRDYLNSDKSNLFECYVTRPSQEKLRAEAALRVRMNETGGHDFRITSHSHFFFTCGWRSAADDIIIQTPTQEYRIPRPF